MNHNIITSPSFSIRRLEVADALQLASFYNRLSQASKRTFRPIGPITIPEKCAEIAADNHVSEGYLPAKFDLVATYKAEIIGWGFIWDVKTDKPTFGLAVADNFHGQGIGKLLMTRVMEWAKIHKLPEVHLTVVQDNVVAWMLYKKQGFVQNGEFIGDDGESYFSMITTIDDKAA